MTFSIDAFDFFFKTICNQPDIQMMLMRQSLSTAPNQLNASSQSSSLSPPGQTVPLKKRLLHAYNNEQCSSSLL